MEYYHVIDSCYPALSEAVKEYRKDIKLNRGPIREKAYDIVDSKPSSIKDLDVPAGDVAETLLEMTIYALCRSGGYKRFNFFLYFDVFRTLTHGGETERSHLLFNMKISNTFCPS